MAKASTSAPAPVVEQPEQDTAMDLTLLQSIVTGTQSEQGCYFTTKEALETGNLITDPPVVEYNEEYRNPQNADEFGVRITPEGLAAVNDTSEQTEHPEQQSGPNMFSRQAAAANAAQITIDASIPVPQARSRSGGPSKYPFEQLQPGQSFFVPGKDVAKAMPSTVAAQNGKYATDAKNADGSIQMREGTKREKQADGTTKTWKDQVPVKEYSKFFICRSTEEGNPKVKGVRVWRQK